jgi:hypothetical protein
MKSLLVAIAVALGAVAGRAQVSVTTEQSPDKSQSSSQVAVSAGDHTFVPLTVETKKTTDDANTSHTDSTTKALLGDGSYFDWRKSSSETKKLSDSVTEKSNEVVEQDRQGVARVTKSTTERITKDADGTVHDSTSHYRRNSSGALVIESETAAVSKTNPDGSVSTVETETRTDLNGGLKPVQRSEGTTTKVSGTETQTSKIIQTFNHIDGGFTDSAREMTTERKDGNTTTTETVVQKPAPGGGWQNQTRTTTTEVKASDGTTQRETVVQVRPAYAPSDSGASNASLVPREKTVEHEVRQPDGTTVIEQQVLHRDINGDWKPDTFSTAGAHVGY